jgi:hypothetical protein
MPQFIKDKIEEKEEAEAEDNPHHPSPGMRNEAKKGKKAEMPDFIKEKIEEKEEEADEEACGPKGKKSKAKAAKASYEEEDGDFGDLDDEEVMLIKQYRNSSKTTAKPSADSTIKKPFNEEKKDFGDIIPQPGLDPNKNNVNKDNTTSPGVKLAAKAKGKAETDVEEIMESPDQQEKEDESDHTHEQTLSTPAPGAKKGKKAESASLEPKASKEALPQAVMDYIKQLVDKEKQANDLGGINKNDVVGQPDQDEEESVLEKKDAKKGKAKAESIEKCVKDNCADDTTKVHEDGCAPTDGNTTAVGDLQPLAGKSKTFDNVVEAAVERFATVAKAKKEAEEQLSKMGESLAFEKNAKSEAYAAVAQLQAKFEALMGKVAQIEASDKSIEMKAAKIVSATASEAVAVGMEGSGLKTDQEVMNQFEAIVDAREKNKFFMANRKVIEGVAMSNLKRRAR